ncbi:hypothetical protein BURMUCGD2M_5115 [Burkholderia multivorans CGD2M]|uniref:Uncharacterized protein n=1 Tax=Burkholderia multivorans CGD2 TaxID=513052 RepID=B9BJ66_9BURK|nr:hypothetical protein BURMUCGD2_5122 [Burkholderia multivorans CGD2]EEE15672.1 hypothetical protein BURMUCGD2M_5115 [Burkholderia multivorans CGD2M]
MHFEDKRSDGRFHRWRRRHHTAYTTMEAGTLEQLKHFHVDAVRLPVDRALDSSGAANA